MQIVTTAVCMSYKLSNLMVSKMRVEVLGGRQEPGLEMDAALLK
jgi:hypothetical protein